MISHFIFYVLDQEASTRFYERVLLSSPVLNVPGMTEFQLDQGAKLGLMPYEGISRLLGPHLTSSDQACGNPNSELYLIVDDPFEYHQRSIEHGAKELSPVQERDWGALVGYSRDIDGHILAFAKPS
ncbi:hypothetical protein TUMSATVNIG1_38770 [Vibrio nigripulchritudo]|uniref:VOC family protein n=1 Tax=Vibrio nigripulchritudo TaxID=28173 RepID=UPI00190C3889|nr:VOC family protein [Vibrio nigripulchritudo]BCL71910.1 hypothetical protein VNTUMSATTG_38470 [Vibrio nigripulchritudo]BDU33268.1 hypothetical protein TUMSATVNIG1_38770 [Vibrio nigripulchritudo]